MAETRAAFGVQLRAEFLLDATRARPKAVPPKNLIELASKVRSENARRLARSGRRLASSISSSSRHCGTGRQSHASPFPGHWTKAAVHPKSLSFGRSSVIAAELCQNVISSPLRIVLRHSLRAGADWVDACLSLLRGTGKQLIRTFPFLRQNTTTLRQLLR
jgi:hypothetical protein